MNRKRPLLLTLALVLLIGGAALLYPRLAAQNAAAQLPAAEPAVEDETAVPADETQAEAQEVPPAPNVTLYDAAGESVELESFFDKPIVLNFWASWCGPCRSEMPVFQAAYDARGDEVHFLMVNATTGRETLQNAQDLLAEEGYTFPVYFDLTGEGALTYGVPALPTTYFIGAGGTPVVYAIGALNAETLERGLAMILPQG